MNERGRIRFGNTTIDYEVRRSERRKKTVQITTDGGGVQVAAPMTTPDSELRAIVRKRALWILSHAFGEMLEAAPKRFVSGETLPYLGRNVRMIVDTADYVKAFCDGHAAFAFLGGVLAAGGGRFASTTGASGSQCRMAWMTVSAMNASAAPLSSGTGTAQPRGCRILWNAGGPGSVAERSRRYSSATSANAGAAAHPTVRCASTGAP